MARPGAGRTPQGLAGMAKANRSHQTEAGTGRTLRGLPGKAEVTETQPTPSPPDTLTPGRTPRGVFGLGEEGGERRGNRQQQGQPMVRLLLHRMLGAASAPSQGRCERDAIGGAGGDGGVMSVEERTLY